MGHFLEDVTLGQILAAVAAVFTFLNLLFSGRAFQILRRSRDSLERLTARIGNPNPRHVSLSGGRDLYQKVESLEDTLRTAIENDLIRRAQAEAREQTVDR